MIRTMICTAAAGAFVALAMQAPAQARMFDPALQSAAPAVTENAQYWYDPYRHRRWEHRRRHHRCWYERVRVRTPGGYFVWRSVRRCAWRYW